MVLGYVYLVPQCPNGPGLEALQAYLQGAPPADQGDGEVRGPGAGGIGHVQCGEDQHQEREGGGQVGENEGGEEEGGGGPAGFHQGQRGVAGSAPWRGQAYAG